MLPGRLLSNWHFHCAELYEHGAPDRRLEQSYDDAMNALANYLTREDDAQTTVDWLHRIPIAAPQRRSPRRYHRGLG